MNLRTLVLSGLTLVLVTLGAIFPPASPAILAAPAPSALDLKDEGQTGPADWSAIYLPIAVAPPPIYFADDFDAGVGKWTPFVNYWRLNPQQWFWDPFSGYENSNAYTHNWCRGVGDCDRGAHDALTMYLGPGSSEWTDYRYSVRFRAQNGRQAGIWFRGAYKNVETRGQWLTGYYFTVVTREEGTHPARLWQLRTEEETGGETFPEYWYHFSNPFMLREVEINTSVQHGEWYTLTVEAQGPRFRCYVDDELVIDHTDTEGSVFLKGTIGLYTFGSDPYNAIINFDDVLVEPLGSH